jgi:hypothetical protein
MIWPESPTTIYVYKQKCHKELETKFQSVQFQTGKPHNHGKTLGNCGELAHKQLYVTQFKEK